MLPAMLVACVSAGAVAVAVGRLRAVTSLLPSDPESLRSAVRAGSRDAIASAVRPLFSDEDASAVLSQSLFDGSSPEAAIAALNEQLGEVARALTLGRGVPQAAGRAALASGTLAAVLEIVASISAGAPAAWSAAVWEFGTGAIGAITAFELGRRSAVQTDRVRAAWDQVAAVFAGRLGQGMAGRESEGLARAFLPAGKTQGE